MQYGYFDDEKREYVVTRPDTPWPWINYLGDQNYCAIVSNNAGGWSFNKSPGQNRILRHRFNGIPMDRSGRYVYLRDAVDGDYWSNSWAPVQKPPEEHQTKCRHGIGYTTIESQYHGISSSVTYVVPLNEELELWHITVRNDSSESRSLDLFTYGEFSFPFMSHEWILQATAYVAEMDCTDGVVHYSTPVPGWEWRDCFMASTTDIVGFDARRESFIGSWRDESNPIAVETGSCSGSAGTGGNACGALQMKLQLAPGESWTSTIIVGEGDLDVGRAAKAKWTDAQVANALADLKEYWDVRLDQLQCRTPEAALDSSINIWNAYQAHVIFRWSRSASYIEAGDRDGLGYRDTLQDTLAVIHTEPERVKQTIKDLLRGQAANGSALHKVQPLTLETGKGEMPDNVYSDDHLWLPLAIYAYVAETGDRAFLEEDVDWLDEGQGTVIEHCRRAIEFSWANRGEHELLFGLAADWNDALQIGRDGESVWTSIQFCIACRQYAAMARSIGDEDNVDWSLTLRNQMAEWINEKAWDGDWYRRALMEDGSYIGSAVNEIARIFLNPQAWSIMAGIADNDRGRQAMDAVYEHLFSEFGVHIFLPPHTDLRQEVHGRVCYPPGFKENGAIFCHPNPWAVIAECLLGRGDRAWQYFRALLPSSMNDRADLRQVEPYVYSQFVAGKDSHEFGRAHNPWVTGTSTWSYVAVTQYLLGVRPVLSGLEIDPCIPKDWDGFTVTRVFRGATYEIEVSNPDHVSKGVKELSADGEPVIGGILAPAPAGTTVQVKVVLG